MDDIFTSINQLTPEKQELLELLIAESGSEFNCFPLSFAQQRLWFVEQFNPNTSTYNISAAVQLSGLLNVTALHQSLNEIVRRHEALRTTFATVKGQPMQIVAEATSVNLVTVDLRKLLKSQQEAEVQQQAIAEAERPFDLSKSPLLRTTLLQLGETEHVLLLTMHHIISDGWSLGVFVREVAALYRAFLDGKSSPLPELPIQYADFAQWQREWLQGEELQEQLAYWQQQLGEQIPVLELPTDRSRPAFQSFRGGRHPLILPQTLTEALKALSYEEESTLFMTLLCAFNVLLYRYTGQDNILVGTPIANRLHAETEGLIGCFINALPLRTNLRGNSSFRELLRRVREVALGAYAHQDMPFEKLVEVVQSERDTSRHPLFQVMFALQNAPMPALELPGLTLRLLDVDSSTAKFDLTLELSETPEGLRGFFEYNTDLFDADTICRMAGHFYTLLEGILAAPEGHLAALPLLSEAEQQQLLAWNDTKTPYPKKQCIHELFEVQVEQTPDAVAIVCEDQQLTYRELNQRANQLAHYLQKLGVGPEVCVAICMERSLELVVGLLGILKTGGAYVPLDPTYPTERLVFMMEDTRSTVLLTQQRLVKQLPVNGVQVVCVDTEWEHIARQSQENLVSSTTSNNLAYVMYTSGSTGKSKGISVIHQGVVRLVKNTNYANLTAKQIFLQCASISFDASTFEIWGSLLNGAQLVVFPAHTPSLEELGQIIQQYQVTTLWLTASLFHQMVEGHLESLRHISQLLAGGDVLSTSHVQKVLQELDGCTLINGYGPTENTTFTCCYPSSGSNDVGSSVSIGRPICNTQVYVLDCYLQPVPIGIPGELYIGGDGLARDYLNRPELTAQKFIPNPFSNEPGSRLYKTGDLVRYLSDGNIEFLGRLDYQVKIRGFRIELGEIEVVLAQHPVVRETVVVAREDHPGNKRLVAYVVPNQEQVPTSSELRRFLQQTLPDYMIPSTFVLLKALPLLPNGKIDRRALPTVDAARPELETGYVAPQSPVEEVLAGIWADILGLEGVGIHDNFFELGGHSLLAIQLISRLRDTFGVELPVRRLFESPTVAALGEYIEVARHKQHLPVAPLLPVERGTETELPLSFAQARLWFLHQLEPSSTAYNTPAIVHLSGLLHVEALKQSLREIVRRHEVLRTTFGIVNGSPVQVIAPTLTITLPLVNLQQLPKDEREAEVQRLAQQEVAQPFYLATGPLLRGMLLQLGEQEHVLLLVMHHIVCDGWSMGVLIQELATLYEAFLTVQSSPLPELPIQYADFAHWQRQWLQGEMLETQLAYWQQQLAGAPMILELPTDRPRPSVQSFRGAFQSFELSPSLTQRVKLLSQHSGLTLFMTLLTAFQTLLWYYSGQEDISVGSPIANRNRRETEELIGFFVNTLVLRTDLSGNPSFGELLSQVKQVALGAYAHQDVPFEKLVETLHPERSRSHTPLFQVWFVLQNAPMPSKQFPGLNMKVLDLDSGMVRHDLKLGLWDSESLQGLFEYKTDLFDASTIVRMVECFETLLETVVEQPDIQLNTLAKILKNAQLRQQSVKEKEIEATSIQKLKKVKRKVFSAL